MSQTKTNYCSTHNSKSWKLWYEKLPVITGYDAIKALRKAGFIAMRQRGSHVGLKKIEDGKTIKITVPVQGTLKKGTLTKIIKEAGLTLDEFLRLL